MKYLGPRVFIFKYPIFPDAWDEWFFPTFEWLFFMLKVGKYTIVPQIWWLKDSPFPIRISGGYGSWLMYGNPWPWILNVKYVNVSVNANQFDRRSFGN